MLGKVTLNEHVVERYCNSDIYLTCLKDSLSNFCTVNVTSKLVNDFQIQPSECFSPMIYLYLGFVQCEFYILYDSCHILPQLEINLEILSGTGVIVDHFATSQINTTGASSLSMYAEQSWP